MKMHCLLVAACLVVPSAARVKEPIEKLIEKLGDKAARDEIGRRGEAAVKPLAKVMRAKKEGQFNRMFAASLLAQIGGKNAVSELRSGLADKDVQVWAVIALGDLGDAARDAVPDLAKVLREEPDAERLAFQKLNMIEALEKIGGNSQEAVDALVLCMKSRRCDEAAYALIQFGEPGAEALVTLAAAYSRDKRPEDERRYGETFMVTCWGRPRLPKEMIPVFQKHFEKGDDHARRVAGQALAGVGAAAIPVLAKYLDNKNPEIRREAAGSLSMINWFAARARERGEKVENPVNADEFYPKLKKIYKLPNGDVDSLIMHNMLNLDKKRFMEDPEMVKALQDEFDKAFEEAVKRQKDRK